MGAQLSSHRTEELRVYFTNVGNAATLVNLGFVVGLQTVSACKLFVSNNKYGRAGSGREPYESMGSPIAQTLSIRINVSTKQTYVGSRRSKIVRHPAKAMGLDY
jgi:hypothetical protein